MDKRKTTLMGGSVLVLALVAAISIVYAAYSQSLTINGTASAKANLWKIVFLDLEGPIISGEAQELTAPTINNNETTISGYSVLLSKPGDSIYYYFDIQNQGTFNAALNEINIKSPVCTGIGDTAEEDAEKVCKYLKYDLYVTPGGTEMTLKKYGIPIGFRSGRKISDFISKVIIKLEYDSDVPAEDLPQNDVAVSLQETKLEFVQSN